MKFFKDSNGKVWAFESDGSQDHLIKDGMVPCAAPLPVSPQVTAKQKRDEALEQLVHDFGDGRVMQVRKSDEQNIRNAIEIMQRHQLSTYSWFMADNTMHDVTLAELQTALESGQDQAAIVWQEFFSNV